MIEPTSVIGDRLRDIRVHQNLSLDDASKLTGVSKPMLGQIERGQSIPTITTLWKIATGLKTPLSSFLQERQSEYTVINTGQFHSGCNVPGDFSISGIKREDANVT